MIIVGGGQKALDLRKVGGFAAGLIRNLSAEEILRQAATCGTASALTPGVATLDPDETGRLRQHFVVERIG